MADSPRRRIGCVPYLNAKPLLWTLEGNPRVSLILRPPADLVPLFADGGLEAALLPSLEVARNGWAFLPGIGIASPGRTASVLLHRAGPLRRIRTVALDRNSRTTNALARILLERFHGLRPAYRWHDPSVGVSLRGPGDAAVTIGDASFRPSGFPTTDLGGEWRRWTGLPFVFALWAVRDPDPGLARLLRSSAREGLRHLGDTASRHHERLRLSERRCRAYLRDCLTYRLGPRERRAFRRFAREAAALEPIPGELPEPAAAVTLGRP